MIHSERFASKPGLAFAISITAFVAGSLFLSKNAHGYEYTTRLQGGFYQSQEEHTEPSGNTTSNDFQRYLASMYVNLTKWGPMNNEFVFDLRDKYDTFGGLDGSALRLVETNEPQLRQLAIKLPPEESRLSWSLGRFAVTNAAVLGNDGAELAYHSTQRLRLGIFAGLYPEHDNERTLRIDLEDPQAGLYTTYDDLSRDWNRRLQATSALVVRRSRAEAQSSSLSDEGKDTLPSAAEGATAEKPATRAFWYTNMIHQPDLNTRMTLLSHIDLAPEAHVRNLWSSFHHRLSRQWSGNLSLLHLDPTEYERQRDSRDHLGPSVYTRARGDVRFKLSRHQMFQTDVSHGVRAADSRSRTEGAGKIVFTALLSGHLSAFLGGGLRRNFLSRDTFVRAGAVLYSRYGELSLTQHYVIEHHDDGETLHPIITELTSGFVINENILGSLSLEYAKDEKVTIVSALATIGFRVGSDHYTPVRSRAPTLERM